MSTIKAHDQLKFFFLSGPSCVATIVRVAEASPPTPRTPRTPTRERLHSCTPPHTATAAKLGQEAAPPRTHLQDVNFNCRLLHSDVKFSCRLLRRVAQKKS